MRARAWLRVSTSKQDEETQLSAVVRRIGYGDRGVSWAFDAERDLYRAHAVHGDDSDHPLRRAVFESARRGEFGILVVWALDRFSRADILSVLQDREALARAGVRLVSVQEEWAENDLLVAVAAWQANQELRRKRERAKLAVDYRREQIAKQGYFVNAKGERVTALGRKRKVVIPEAALARAFLLRAGGFGWQAAAKRLAAEGLWQGDKATLRRACKRVEENRPGKAA